MTAEAQSTTVKVALVAMVAAVYAIGFWPSWMLRDAVLHAAGDPPYNGIWKFIPHVLLYSTLAAASAAVAWGIAARSHWIAPPAFGWTFGIIPWSILAAIIGLAFALGSIVAMGQASAIHYIPPDYWSIGGNLFSNFYEEFIFRGFVLAALTAVFGFWPAAIISSAMWAAMHAQYPLPLQVAIFGAGVVFAWIKRTTKSLWAPWVAHMLLDIIGDSLVG